MVSGASFINKEYLLEKSHAQFADLAKNRHSIRAFSNEEITREELMRVIKQQVMHLLPAIVSLLKYTHH